MTHHDTFLWWLSLYESRSGKIWALQTSGRNLCPVGRHQPRESTGPRHPNGGDLPQEISAGSIAVVIDQNTYCTQFRDKVQQGKAEYLECPNAQVKAGGATIRGFRAGGMVIPRSWNHFQDFQIILLWNDMCRPHQEAVLQDSWHLTPSEETVQEARQQRKCQVILISAAGYVSVSGNSVELGHGPVIQTAHLHHFFTYISDSALGPWRLR